MKTLFCIICFLLLAPPIWSYEFAEKWKTQNTMLEVTFLGLWIADWHQTGLIVDNDEGWYERNTTLGKNPSHKEVNMYFALGALLHPLASMFLPSLTRLGWQYTSIGYEARTVHLNLTIGLW